MRATLKGFTNCKFARILNYYNYGVNMKKTVFSMIFVFVICGSLFADPVIGFWKSIDDETGELTAGWEIYEKDGLLYGEIISLVGFPADQKAEMCDSSYKGFPLKGNVSEMTVIGTPWIFGLEKEDEGEWDGGKVIDPESGKMYTCEITFHPIGKKYKVETLEMRGKIGPFGRSQYWQRSTLEEVKAIK